MTVDANAYYFFFLQPFAAGRGSPSSAGSNFDDVENERPRLRLGYRTLSSSSMKGVSPGKDENLSSPEHHTKIPTPTKTAQSPRGGQTRFGLSPRTNGNSVKRDNSFEAEAISSSESLDGRFASPLPPHRGEGSSHPPEDAPSVSSGYHSDDVTSGNVENTAQTSATGPPSSSGPAGQKYDPRHGNNDQNIKTVVFDGSSCPL